jgi:hypothetical protein
MILDPASSRKAGIRAFETVRKTLSLRGIVFALVWAKFELREILVSAGFIDRVGEDKVFMHPAYRGGRLPRVVCRRSRRSCA